MLLCIDLILAFIACRLTIYCSMLSATKVQQMRLFYCKSKNSVQKIKIFIIFFVVCCTSVALLVVKWKSVWRI